MLKSQEKLTPRVSGLSAEAGSLFPGYKHAAERSLESRFAPTFASDHTMMVTLPVRLEAPESLSAPLISSWLVPEACHLVPFSNPSRYFPSYWTIWNENKSIIHWYLGAGLPQSFSTNGTDQVSNLEQWAPNCGVWFKGVKTVPVSRRIYLLCSPRIFPLGCISFHYGGFYSLSCNNLEWKRIWKGMCVTESLKSTALWFLMHI